MSTHRFLQVDVFTDRPLTGNQLAVFPEPAGLDTATMQAIAREMAFSETTFVWPAERAGTDCRVRIFTPRAEVPVAGHPTIGTTFALAHIGRLPPGTPRAVLDLGIGPTAVDLVWQGGRLTFVWMTQPVPRFGPVIGDLDGVAEALGLAGADVRAAGLPIEVGSIGLPFCLVPLASRAAVDAARVEAARLAAVLRAAGSEPLPVFVFTTEPGPDGATAYCRMFAPGFGVAEDPATGSAQGPLGAYLVRHAVVPAGEITSVQGVVMGRPSRIRVAVQVEDGRVVRVLVGGEAIVVAEGTLAAG